MGLEPESLVSASTAQPYLPQHNSTPIKH